MKLTRRQIITKEKAELNTEYRRDKETEKKYFFSLFLFKFLHSLGGREIEIKS